jgi:hypothetical protein
VREDYGVILEKDAQSGVVDAVGFVPAEAGARAVAFGAC